MLEIFLNMDLFTFGTAKFNDFLMKPMQQNGDMIFNGKHTSGWETLRLLSTNCHVAAAVLFH